MEEPRAALSREEIVFQRMRDFHLQRVAAVANTEVPLQKCDGGVLVLHLIPECSVLGRRRLEGQILKQYGSDIRPLGNHGGNTRFNVDGFLNQSGYHEKVRAYSQLFRDGRLESVMSDVGYPVNQHAPSAYAIRCGLVERAVFAALADYLKFCKAVNFRPPLWLFSALVECRGFRIMRNRFMDLSDSDVDRSPALLPELEITSFEAAPERLLHPWCDALWQATGFERSFNYDQDGNWHEPR